MNEISKRMFRKGTRTAALLALAASGIGASVGSGAASASGSPKTLTVGGIFPFTGPKALLSDWGTHGVATGIYEVNNNGGVLGHKLVASYVDDSADSVDTLPAFRKLMLKKPVVIVGPFSPTIEAVVNQFKANDVVDMMIGGLTTLDTMNYPFVFRTTSSDSNESVAMAEYAISKGWKTASLIFDNSANSQGFIAPLIKAYKALGGKVLADITLTPGQPSYSSELTQAFAHKPGVIFNSMDTQTASTLWTDGQQLGYMNTPWIGDDLQSSAVYAKAFGPTVTTKLTAALAAAPSGSGYTHFLSDYKKVFHSNQPLPTTFNEYDAVVISSLAMTLAGSTDPKVWVNDVIKVSNPPGTKCSNYAACVKLIKAHRKINYEGAGGSDDFNSHHNVFSGFQMVGFNSSLANVVRAYVTPTQIAAVVAKEK